MHQVTAERSWPLFGVAATRRLEQAAAAALPPHTLMQRAGLATARLAMAIAPHARHLWVACGPGNNGGDGLEAALHWHRWGRQVTVTLAADAAGLPPDAAASWRACVQAGVPVATTPPAHWDLCIDALLGLGTARPLDGVLAGTVATIHAGAAPVLAVDVPSGLAADTGMGEAVRASHTLSLLTLKPGLFTGHGRDAAGTVWFDDLQVLAGSAPPDAVLLGPPPAGRRPHASHKGSYGDVAVLGGAPGMAGAAVLAASAALHAGAGRVFLALLDPVGGSLIPGQPELMLRDWRGLALDTMTVACGCGGGEAVAQVLPEVLARTRALVLDADALNAIAADPGLQDRLRARTARALPTVLTPHPLEAARLLGTGTAEVQADRLATARALSERFGAVAVLKGSGTVVAAPGAVPRINPTGNALLATGGTGDVLAGLLAAVLAQAGDALAAAEAAVFRHGAVADRWPAGAPFTAGRLARGLAP